MGRFIFPQTTRRPKWLLASLGLYILCLFEARGCGGDPEGRGCVQPHVKARRAEHGDMWAHTTREARRADVVVTPDSEPTRGEA